MIRGLFNGKNSIYIYIMHIHHIDINIIGFTYLQARKDMRLFLII